jgi:hypothetical protein
MNPARSDFIDVCDKTMFLIRRNLLKAGNCPENPAYRLIRHKVTRTKVVSFIARLTVTKL